jgi:RNA polymerase sigma-70 factor (ECF subfamily)
MLSDKQLLDLYKAGDKSVISQLLERHSRRLRDYIRMMVKDADIADDLLQEVLIKVAGVMNDGRYTDKGRFQPWLMRIAHNRVLDYFRAQKQNRYINEASAGYDIIGSTHIVENSVEDDIISEQIAKDLRSLIEELPDEQREVVKLRYYDELSFKEIAEQTNVSINTALGRMRYALINLRKMIKERKLALC